MQIYLNLHIEIYIINYFLLYFIIGETLYWFFSNYIYDTIHAFSFLMSAPSAHGISGQGSNPSCSCDPCHSCGKARSLTHCTGPRSKLGWRLKPHICSNPSCCSWIPNPLCHSRNSYFRHFIFALWKGHNKIFILRKKYFVQPKSL